MDDGENKVTVIMSDKIKKVENAIVYPRLETIKFNKMPVNADYGTWGKKKHRKHPNCLLCHKKLSRKQIARGNDCCSLSCARKLNHKKWKRGK